MKPFDLAAAKRGDPVCLKSGTVVEIFISPEPGCAYVVRTPSKELFLINESGLFMVPKKRTVYVTLFHDGTADWVDEPAYVARCGKKVITGARPIEIED